MTKSRSEMLVIMHRASIHTLKQSKLPLNPAKSKVSPLESNYIQHLTLGTEVAEPHPPSQLKIVIPKDATKPDGDAVEDGILLSATELQRRGHFVYSPSDAVVLPIPSEQSRNKSEGDDSAKDRTYQPPKHSNPLDDEAPQTIYTTEGEEITSETEYGRELVRKCLYNTIDCSKEVH